MQDYHKYIFILNNDVIIDSVNVQNLKTSLRKNNADIAGPVLYFDNSKNEDIWACGGFIRKFNFEIRGIDDILQEIPYEVQYIPAAAVIFTKSVWEKIGGFSEKYFLGYEEAEICIKAKRLGKKVIAVPSSFGLHKVGMSKSGNSDRYLYNYYRSKIIFAKFYIGNFIGSLLIYPITFFESILIEPRRFFIWIKVFQHEFINKPFVHESLPLN